MRGVCRSTSTPPQSSSKNTVGFPESSVMMAKGLGVHASPSTGGIQQPTRHERAMADRNILRTVHSLLSRKNLRMFEGHPGADKRRRPDREPTITPTGTATPPIIHAKARMISLSRISSRRNHSTTSNIVRAPMIPHTQRVASSLLSRHFNSPTIPLTAPSDPPTMLEIKNSCIIQSWSTMAISVLLCRDACPTSGSESIRVCFFCQGAALF